MYIFGGSACINGKIHENP